RRLRIAAAGIAVETALAGLSLLGWALTPPGALRSAFFYLGTTSLLMTVALNSSPFMRFDGYYVLSDWLGMPNLHERAGAVARAWLRRRLLGWEEAWPEPLSIRKRRAMVAFALATWMYRLALFLGIAVAVYLMFFKVLGIFLFAVEIAWFVVRPVAAELRVWWRRRAEIRHGHRFAWMLLLGGGLGLLAFPWAHDIHAPAQLRAEYRNVYSPFAGRITSLQRPGPVGKGTAVVALDSPQLRNDAQRARINAESTRAALQSATLAAEQGSEQIGRLGVTIEQFEAETAAAGEELARLRLVAGFPAVWTDIEPTLTVGSWVRPQDTIGTLVDPSSWLVEAWVTEDDVQHLPVGAAGLFYADNAVDPPVRVVVQQVDTGRASTLSNPAMSTDHGGPVPTSTEGRTLVPRQALYLARLAVQGAPAQLRWSRGRVVVEGNRHSRLWTAVNYAVSVLVRESGF
ncbi:MAG TPA: HlyD family secretion protein, partial [Ramlibacter sp.]|nr:HlyD family secretion protein [Ramlibacter sp.]